MDYPTTGEQFQGRVAPWMQACFGAEISADKVERNHRFLEEALEAVQAAGCSASEAHQLVDYVYGRPVGELSQEVGGVMVTLAALCLANGLDMHIAGDTELSRIWTKVDAIRAKQAAKPKHSPLPQAAIIDAAYERAMLEKNHREEFVATSRDGERFTETSVGHLLDDEGAVGQTIYVGQGVKRTASYFLPDPDTIIDEMANAASEEADEFADGYPSVSEDAKKALAVALHNWAKEHVGDPDFFTVTGSAEHVVTQEDLDQR